MTLHKIRFITLVAAVVVVSVCPYEGRCQNTVNQQIWAEYIVQYPFANVYNVEFTGTYSTVTNSPRWRAFDTALQIERAFGQNIDINFNTLASFTQQTEGYNTFEVRPAIGMRVHLTPNKRVLLRFLTRYELRNMHDQETGDWTTTSRLRLRPEALIPITKKTYFEDKMLYGILDLEWFIALDGTQEERFANRFRLRTGLGYRLSYTWRFEFLYLLQESRNGIDESFESTDNIFRFRIKHYLHKSKPVHDNLDGDGGAY